MLVAIADDLSGAAEIGGVGWRHGLTTEIQLQFTPETDAHLVALDTDTRSTAVGEATHQVRAVALECRIAGVEQIYKKVDSVLRGHIVAELVALLESWPKPRALLVPSNPRLGRRVSDSLLKIDDVLLHRTAFAHDPDYPALTSEVRELLLLRAGDSRGQWPIYVRAPGSHLPELGIVVGEAESTADLDAWAALLEPGVLPAGAAEFFAACLRACGHATGHPAPTVPMPDPGERSLFVCGSASAYTHAFCTRCEANGIPVLRIPEALFHVGPTSTNQMNAWADDVMRALEHSTHVVASIDRPLDPDPRLPDILTDRLAAMVLEVLHKCPVHHLLAEGGSTARALVERLGWLQLRVVRELTPGVVTLHSERAPGTYLTMKPGSYRWPDPVWHCRPAP